MNLRIRQLGAAVVMTLALARVASAQPEEEKTPLGKKMSAINTAFKAVGRQIDDASKNADTMEQLNTIETNAKAALTLEPAKKEKVPAGDQAKFMTDYQAGMKHFIETVGKMRAALKAGKQAEASAMLDSLKTEQREGHKEFRLRKPGAPPSSH